MNSIKRNWKKSIIYLLKLKRAIGFSLSAAKSSKTKQDRMIVKVVSSVLDSPGIKIYYHPHGQTGPRVYIHTKDKKYIICLSKSHVRISNHKFFFSSYITDQMSDSLIQIALNKLEKEMERLEFESIESEDSFMSEIYQSFRKKTLREEMKSSGPLNL
jgi:hypothetical protein